MFSRQTRWPLMCVYFCMRANGQPHPRADTLQQQLVIYKDVVANGAETRPLRSYPMSAPDQQVFRELISVEQLKHIVSRKARNVYSRADRLAKVGRHREAVAKLEEAIRYDSEFAEAYNNLGAEYAELGRLEQARTSLRRAADLDPHSWYSFYNLSVVSYRLGDLGSAEQSARRAVGVSRANPRVHFLLGLLLSLRQESRAEGIEHLRYAGRTFSIPEQSLR